MLFSLLLLESTLMILFLFAGLGIGLRDIVFPEITQSVILILCSIHKYAISSEILTPQKVSQTFLILTFPIFELSRLLQNLSAWWIITAKVIVPDSKCLIFYFVHFSVLIKCFSSSLLLTEVEVNFSPSMSIYLLHVQYSVLQ